MGVQVRIKGAGGIMPERGTHYVAGEAFRFVYASMNLCSGEVL
jgi:hypothetical protein